MCFHPRHSEGADSRCHLAVVGLLLALSSRNLLHLELESPGGEGEGRSWAGALVCGPQALKAEHGGRGALCGRGRGSGAHSVLSWSH